MKIASLGMYDRPELQAANDAVWAGIAANLNMAGLDVSMRLDRSRSLQEIWDDPDLILGQCCGYPLTTRYHERLRLIATPAYRVDGCEGGWHRSRIIVSRSAASAMLADFRGARAAFNEETSNTGMNLFRAAVAPFAVAGRFFGETIRTGSHAASARLVAQGKADIAAVDAVTYAHIERLEPTIAAQLRTLCLTAATPGLPLVTSWRTDTRTLRQIRAALAEIMRDAALATALGDLSINDFVDIPLSDYAVIPALERDAQALGYSILG